MNTNRFELQVKRQKAAASPRLRNKLKCPMCHEIDLVMTECQGVEIDYCPKCLGVWMDQDELEKVVGRTAIKPVPFEMHNHTIVERDGYGEPYDERQGYNRRNSWLGELFD